MCACPSGEPFYRDAINTPEVFPARGNRLGRNEKSGAEKRRKGGEAGNAAWFLATRAVTELRGVIDRAHARELI